MTRRCVLHDWAPTTNATAPRMPLKESATSEEITELRL
jgi:hypothetical protein